MSRRHELGLSLLIPFLFSILVPGLSAQESIVVDEESLFGESDDGNADSESNLNESVFGSGNGAGTGVGNDGGDGLITEAESAQDIGSILLVSEMVEIGGRYQFSGQSTWIWDDPDSVLENLGAPTITMAGVDLDTTLFFDARPSQDLRVFGKATISYPFL